MADVDTFIGTVDPDFQLNIDDSIIYGLNGGDTLVGIRDIFTQMYGGEGADHLDYAGLSFAHIYGGEGNDVIGGGSHSDHLYGDEGADLLLGRRGDDFLDGGLGNDRLDGGPAKNVLVGGLGKDAFILRHKEPGANRDTFLDFSVADDTVWLDNSNAFTRLQANDGVLARGAFRIANGAKDPSDRIIYNDDNGALIYDANGNAPGLAILIAVLDPDLNMTNKDFLVI